MILEQSSVEITTFQLSSIIIFVILSLCILVANIFIIISQFRDPCVQHSSYYFMYCLAIADVLAGLLSGPLLLYIYYAGVFSPGKDPWIYTELWFIPNLTAVVTYLHVFLITSERFVSVYMPRKRDKWFTIWRMRLMSLSTWLMSITWWCLPFIGLAFNGVTLLVNTYYVSLSVLIFFISPFIVTTFMWIFIFSKLHKIKRKKHFPVQIFPEILGHADPPEVEDDHLSKDDRTIIITVCYIFINGCVGYIPNFVWWIMSIFVTSSPAMNVFSLVGNALQLGNSLTNPIIYTYRIQHF